MRTFSKVGGLCANLGDPPSSLQDSFDYTSVVDLVVDMRPVDVRVGPLKNANRVCILLKKDLICEF